MIVETEMIAQNAEAFNPTAKIINNTQTLVFV
jgi:hypothetical protein